MRQNRFVIGILIVFDVLIILAFALFCAWQRPDSVVDVEVASVVDNYVEAMVYEDYQTAYSYLANLENKPTYEQFRQAFVNRYILPSDDSVSAKVRTIDINGDEASVELIMTDWPAAPFSNPLSTEDRASLVMQDGEWKLFGMLTDYYWDEDWYQKPYWP